MELIPVKMWFLVVMYGGHPFSEGQFPNLTSCEASKVKGLQSDCILSEYHLYEKEIKEIEEQYGVTIERI